MKYFLCRKFFSGLWALVFSLMTEVKSSPKKYVTCEQEEIKFEAL
jgi:hypothetical protein